MYKILIVEDDMVIARAIEKHIETWDCQARCAEDFKDVMAEFHAFEPDLVLLASDITAQADIRDVLENAGLACAFFQVDTFADYAFMMEQLFDHVNMRREAIHVPSGNVADLASAARDYDAAIEAAGGIDIQLLGIGRNGHIGFNEPGECFIDNCHLVTLSQSTIEANTRFFHSVDEVPRQAVSLGIGAIMRARQVVLIATGPDKAQAIHDSVLENVTPQVPCFILRYHPNAIFLLDREAASLL